ncbi:metallophosphoesterase [bacterium]|nr:metallophosphoesterase [bacterium]
MTVWTISDLHLSFGTPNKNMDVFGDKWKNHPDKIKANWEKVIKDDDLVLIAGDVSWGLKPEEVLPDLEWIDALPGTKVISKGNHDLWWKSSTKVRKLLPPSLHIIHNDAFTMDDITIGGTRLWDHPDLNYYQFIDMKEIDGVNIKKKEYSEKEIKHDGKIFKNELDRLARSLDAMDRGAKHRILMIHYPPIPPDRSDNEFSRLIKDAEIEICIYGHLHNLFPDAPVNFEKDGTKYICTACDFLNFEPVKLL